MTFVAKPLLHSSVMRIEPGWVDYNGHLNQAYYGVVLDRSIDEVLLPVGLGPDYIRQRNLSFMTVESHTCFVRELMLSDPVRVTHRILDVDDKRLHMFSELTHAEAGWLSATAEWMFLHVDMATRRTAPWPADIRARLDALRQAADALPRPDRAGRRIGIVRKA